MLIRGGHRQDYLIVNFGLHFTEDYKGELQTIIEQARCARCLPGGLKGNAVSVCQPPCTVLGGRQRCRSSRPAGMCMGDAIAYALEGVL